MFYFQRSFLFDSAINPDYSTQSIIINKQVNANNFPSRFEMGRVKLALPRLSLRPQLRQLATTLLLQTDSQLRCKNCLQVHLFQSSRSTLGSTNAILIPEAQAKCYITVQNNGIAFAALADQ